MNSPSKSIIMSMSLKGESLKHLHPMSDAYQDCDFSEAKMGDTVLLSGKFDNCKFDSTNFGGAILAGHFHKCDFTKANFSKAIFRYGVKFANCVMNFANFEGVIQLWMANFDAFCDLNNIQGAKQRWKADSHAYELDTFGVKIPIVKTALQDLGVGSSRDYRGSWIDTPTGQKIYKPAVSLSYPMKERDMDDYEDYYGGCYIPYKPVDKSAVLLTSNEDELKVGK